MRRLLPLSLLLLLAVAFAAAKTSNTTTNLQTPMATSASTQQGTLQGCLSSAGNEYTLTDSSGAIWQLEGNTDQLKPYVGHTVALTGSGNNAAALTGNANRYIDVDMTSVNDFQVSSAKQISPTCSPQNQRLAQHDINAMLAAG
jgi:hypothetical protein